MLHSNSVTKVIIKSLKTDEFDNIFIDMRDFRTEDIALASVGKFLEGSGVEEVLLQTEIFGPAKVKNVVNGGHYNRSKRGLKIFLLPSRLG